MGLRGARVVAIDDDQDTLDLLALVLGRAGARLETVSAPGQALDAIARVVPDVLLIDIAMPGEDGLRLLRRVRRLAAEEGGRTPAAVLTACLATPGRLAEWRAAGFQRHLSKPFLPDELLATVDALAGSMAERRRVARRRRALPASSPRSTG